MTALWNSAIFVCLLFRLWVSRLWHKQPYQWRLECWENFATLGSSPKLCVLVYLVLVEFSSEKAEKAVETVRRRAERRKDWLRKLEGVGDS